MLPSPTPRLDAYWNSHRNCFSLAQRGRVTGHVPDFVLYNVKFVVQPAGRRRVLETDIKNVHAFVRGYNLRPNVTGRFIGYAHYNPIKANVFLMDEYPIYEADQVLLTILQNGRPSIQVYTG
jgi:hypothetical protein